MAGAVLFGPVHSSRNAHQRLVNINAAAQGRGSDLHGGHLMASSQ
jgi:hypothetical protein